MLSLIFLGYFGISNNINQSEDCMKREDYENKPYDHGKNQKGSFKIEPETGLISIFTFTAVSFDSLIPFLITLNLTTTAIIKDTFKMNPNWNYDDVGISDYCPIETD